MKSSYLRQIIQPGVTAGIVHTFFVLIGFNAMLGNLFASILKVKQTSPIPQPVFLLIYCVLLAIFTGYTTARKSNRESAWSSLLAGAVGGVSLGVVTLLVNSVLALLVINEIDPRLYLSMLSKEFNNATLFNLSPFLGVAANFGVFLGGSVLGALINQVGKLPGLTNALSRYVAWVRSAVDSLRHFGSSRFPLVWKVLPLLVLAAGIIVLPLKWGSYWNYVIGSVGLYVILGLGLNLIVGLSGQLVLGYISFFAIGAYSVGLLNSVKPHNLMWGFWPGLLIGIILAALAGILLGLPLMRLRGDYLAIVTLGFGEIIRILLKSDLLTNFTGGPRGIQSIQVPKFFGRDFDHIEFTYLIVLAVLVSIFIYTRLVHSRTGRAWLAIREDETVANATGVNTVKYKLLALALGAALAGLAGGIYAARNQFTGPNEHSLMASINVLSLIIVGGMGSVPGTILGAFALKGLPEILREFENYRLLAFGALLVVMMLSRPEGLIPSRKPTLEIPEDQLSQEKGKEDKDARQ